MSYFCHSCGELHEGLPDLGADQPDYWWGVPEEERDRRIELTTDTCIIDNEAFFVRAVIELPVKELHGSRAFGLGVWVSQKRENFYAYVENLDSAKIGPFFGWLSTDLRYYQPTTINLKTYVHFVGGGERPTVELEPTDHPLAIDQRDGISLEKAWDIVHFYAPQKPS